MSSIFWRGSRRFPRRMISWPLYILLALGLGIMGVLIFAIHVIGEFVRPVSLALRLFGNIFGEETVVATLVALVAVTKFFWLPVQLPNLLLGLLTAFVQALVCRCWPPCTSRGCCITIRRR